MTEFKNIIKEPYTKDGYNWYIADFKSLSQMQLYLESNPQINDKIFKEPSSLTPKNDFNGEPLNDAIKYLTYGYNKDYYQFLSLQKDISNALEIKTERRKNIKSQTGRRVHIPSYVANKPKCMLRLEPQQNKRITNINFNLTYPARNSQQQIINRGILTLNLIKILQMHDYIIGLNAFSLTKVGDELIYIKVNLKKPGEPIDEKKCFYPFCAKEFARRNIFRIRESMPVKNLDWGDEYGSSPNQNEIKQLLHIPKNDIIIAGPDDMNINGDDIYSDANNFFKTINLDENIKVKKLIHK